MLFVDVCRVSVFAVDCALNVRCCGKFDVCCRSSYVSVVCCCLLLFAGC